MLNKTKTEFPVTSSMYLSSNRSWETTNHSACSIHIIVSIEWNNEPNKTWLSSYRKLYLYSNWSAEVLFRTLLEDCFVTHIFLKK